MEKEKFILYCGEGENRKYIEYINRNGASTDSDIGDAIEFDDVETAKKIAYYCNKNYEEPKYKVICIKTTMEEIL